MRMYAVNLEAALHHLLQPRKSGEQLPRYKWHQRDRVLKKLTLAISVVCAFDHLKKMSALKLEQSGSSAIVHVGSMKIVF